MRQLSPLEFNLLIEAEQEVALDRNEQMAIQAFFNAVGANAKKLKKPSDIYKRPSESELKRAENGNTLDKKLEQQKALEDFTKQLDLSQLK